MVAAVKIGVGGGRGGVGVGSRMVLMQFINSVKVESAGSLMTCFLLLGKRRFLIWFREM